MTTVINQPVDEESLPLDHVLSVEAQFVLMDSALGILTNNAVEIEPEFCSLDDHTELSDEFADPFYLVSRMEQEAGAPLVFLKRSTKA